MTLNQIITEPFEIHELYSKKERIERAGELLTLVGLDPQYGSRYPHELSGGQRQRVAIARALTLDSEVIVADEPTSALDVSVKAQIINLLEELKERIGLSMIFISHDLSMVRHISDEIQVMYFGKIVESGPTDEIFDAPVHPYTRVLLEAIPVPNPRLRRRRKLTLQENRDAAEEMLNPTFTMQPPEPSAQPELQEYRPGHLVRCFRRGADA
jgi:ABC-type oligopeptide transport system ATPase subunit